MTMTTTSSSFQWMQCLLLLAILPQSSLGFGGVKPHVRPLKRSATATTTLHASRRSTNRPKKHLNLMHLASADDLRPIEIDDVMSEVQMALREADDALTNSGSSSSSSDAPARTTTSPPSSIPTDVSIEQIQDILSTCMGGIALGTALGLFADMKLPELTSLVDASIPPTVLAVALGGVGIFGAVTDSQAGQSIRLVLGTPTMAAATALTNLFKSLLQALGLAAQRKVEETKSEIRAIPSKVANSAKAKARETVEDIKRIPSNVANSAKQKASETVDDVKASIASLPARTVESIKRGNADELLPLLAVPLVAGVVILNFAH